MKPKLQCGLVLIIILTAIALCEQAPAANLADASATNSAATVSPPPPTSSMVQTFDTNVFVIQKIQDQLTEVRRDQLNYKIEKDILEKTYGSNTQTISTIVTILFGVFAILGFFGLKDITTLKKDFVAELDKARDARRRLEAKANELEKKQATIEDEYKKLYEQNEKHTAKLKALELIEKIEDIMTSGNYQWGLENLAVALNFDPLNPRLLGQKAMCLWRIDDLANALLTYKQILQIDPRDESALTNCLELMLLQKDFDVFARVNLVFAAASNDGVVAAVAPN